jgi:proton-translocating NAD(P)+ transhydrogenase subunit alpha
MDTPSVVKHAADLSEQAHDLANGLDALSRQVDELASQAAKVGGHGDLFVFFLTVFVLAIFVGYYVVWRVTPALHSPLMSVTNAISSVIVVGALIAAGPAGLSFSKAMGFIAVILASVNIFGGFIVTQRMLQMFKKKQK